MEKFKTSGKIIIILGPNASGKSEFAVSLAKKFNGEIISADSRQIYKDLNIGSGKVEGKWEKFSIFNFQFSKKILNSKTKILNKFQIPNSKIQKKFFVYKNIIHHCIDFISPKKIFSAADFKKYGESAIIEILNRKKMPIICGGTGFYIDALLNNINLAKIPPNFKLRKKLEQKSCEELFLELQKLNPKHAKYIDKKNKRRLIRALEIKFYEPQRSVETATEIVWKLETLYLGIKHPPEILKQRIEKRLITRLRQGMIKEVYNLHFKYKLSWKRLYDLGLEYRFISLFLRQKEKIKNSKKLTLKEKKINIKNSYAECLLKIKIESWHYAKRQLTWFKKNKKINWIDLSSENLKMAEKLIKMFLTEK